MATDQEFSNDNFKYKSLQRLFSYPIIHDSSELGGRLYQSIKSSNSLLNFGFTKVENLLKMTKNKVEYYAEPKLIGLDNFCNRNLQKLDKRCPILKTPTHDIIKFPSTLYNDYVGSVVVSPIESVDKIIEYSTNYFIPVLVVQKIESMILEKKEMEDKTNNKYDRIKRILKSSYNKISRKFMSYSNKTNSKASSNSDSNQVDERFDDKTSENENKINEEEQEKYDGKSWEKENMDETEEISMENKNDDVESIGSSNEQENDELKKKERIINDKETDEEEDEENEEENKDDRDNENSNIQMNGYNKQEIKNEMPKQSKEIESSSDEDL